MSETQTDKAILFVILTLILIWTPIMTPVHEFGHVVAAYMVGGSAVITDFNHTQCYNIPHFLLGFISAMGEGFIGIMFSLLYIALKKPYLGIMAKTSLIMLPLEFITLTDHEFNDGGIIWLLAIMVICWVVAFRKKKLTEPENYRQAQTKGVRSR